MSPQFAFKYPVEKDDRPDRKFETGKAWSVVFSFLEFCYASNCKEKVAKQVEHNAFSLLYFIGSILKATFSL